MDIRAFVDNITTTSAGFPDRTFSEKGKAYTCVNPYSYHIVRRNPEVFARMDGLFVDGMLMCRFINLLWKRRIPRLSFDMAGMAVDLFNRLNSPGCAESLYLIGARSGQLELTVGQIRGTYPGIDIAGYRNGYFSDAEERREAIRSIVSLNPDFVLVGMGSPLQERFAADLRDAGFKGIVFTCGGFLHQTSRRINYYPEWVNRFNLRAFYRLYREKGLFKRLYNVLLEFPVLFTLDTFKARKAAHHGS